MTQVMNDTAVDLTDTPPTDGSPDVKADIIVGGDLSGQAAVGSGILQMRVGSLGNLVVEAPSPPRVEARPAPVHALGRRPRGFVDREPETALAASSVQAREALEFHGPEGVGKSTLLRHLAHRLATAHGDADADGDPGGLDGVVVVGAGDHAVDDILQELFDLFYWTDRPYLPTGGRLRHYLQVLRGAVLVDDADLPGPELERLLDSLPECGFVLAASHPHAVGELRLAALAGLDDEHALSLLARRLGRDLRADELPVATRLRAVVEGRPGPLVQAATLVAGGTESLEGVLAAQTQAQDPAATAVDVVPERDRPLLGVLAAIPGIWLTADQVMSLTGLEDAGSRLDMLARRGLARVSDLGDGGPGRYQLRGPVAEAAHATGDLAEARRLLQEHFVGWAAQHRGDWRVPLEQAEAARLVLEVAARDGQWRAVLSLGQAVESSLALRGRWGAWRRVLEAMLQAARALSNRQAEAWALHQLGSRALCLGDAELAVSRLRAALRQREAAGDLAAAAVTRHNLELLRPPPPPPSPPSGDRRRPPPRGRAPIRRLIRKLNRKRTRKGLLVAGAVLSTLIGSYLALTITPGGQSTPLPRPIPAALAFGAQPMNTASTVRTVTVTNTGGAGVRLTGVGIAGVNAVDFQLASNACTAPPSRGAWCTVGVQFVPTARGDRTAQLTLSVASSRSPLVVPLSGTGVRARATAGLPRVTPAALPFGAQAVNTAGAVRTVTVTNIGKAALRVDAVTVTGVNAPDFQLAADRCGAAVTSGHSCTVGVQFVPTMPGARAASLTLRLRGKALTLAVPLAGAGVQPPRGLPRLAPTSLSFGEQQVGTTSSARDLTLSNTGTGRLRVAAVSVEGDDSGDFAVTANGCGAPVGPGRRCSVGVSFGPTALGSRTASLVVRLGDATTPLLVPLGGTGVRGPDLHPPVLHADDLVVEATSTAGAVVSYAVAAVDDVDGDLSVACQPLSGSLFPFGTTRVSCTATDTSGNTATGGFSVTVRDSTPPTVTPPGDVTVEAAGPDGAVVQFAPPTASDSVDGPVAASCQPASAGTFPLGTTMVACEAADSHGNTGTASFAVVVRDTTPPTIGAHEDKVVWVPYGATGAIVTFDPPPASDTVDPAVTVTCDPPSGSVFPLGPTTVTCTAIDDSGNRSGPSSFTVTVNRSNPNR